MQDNLTIFENIPYEVRIIKGQYLTAKQAEEAINDVFSDSSAFFDMPKVSDIIKVKSDNVYGVFKLVVTLSQGSPFPEYMLNARVAELEPKLVNVIFDNAEIEDTPEYKPLEEIEATKPVQKPQRQGVNVVVEASTKLGLTYKELGEQIGYSTESIIESLSSGEVSDAMKRALGLYMENVALKKELEESAKIKTILKEWVK